jgi:pSer/pThr/pTyr-binding forkhead associated (FHA) protein
MNTSRFDATMATKMIVLRRERLRRERELRQHCLEQIEGARAPRRIPLEGDEIILGRAEDASICISSPRASRHHATLTRRGTDFVVKDNDSHNGVFLNGVEIFSAILRDGDIIQIADCTFVYREG